ncbi:MAG: membrane protein insertion efficiency factor YidD [Saprospiraceae bacterium]|nr:membrane protein insertion efficiency factor YidD [Saprospiraceae bacterium]
MVSKILIFFIRIYQKTLSPLLGQNKCQYHPSCSHYSVGALSEWGLWKGLWLGMKRIGRCHPWGGHGYDPVPENPNKHPLIPQPNEPTTTT